MAINCWEFKKCGREPGGEKTREMGVCPAALDESFDGINGGINGGRFCWAVAGTFCEGKKQGEFNVKRESCVKCDFFLSVSRRDRSSGNQAGLLDQLIEAGDTVFLEGLSIIRVGAGERFLVQGTMGDVAYIIHDGTCLAVVEKDGIFHPSGHWGRGDIVGICGLFTGEPHEAHVEAETDMLLWVVNRQQIDNISRQNQDLLNLVTEIVASQFDSKRPVADRKIGKYVATDIIGRGAYSIVYRAIHRDLDMVVAIKMMRHNMVADPEFLDNFRKEAQIVASLNHDAILKVYDFEERYRTVFIISEYLDGESLKSQLARLGRLPGRLVVQYLLQIARGLAYAHGRGIIHRDLHPDNIMVLPDDRIKILDFGLACPIGTEDEQIGGKLAYQAPELLQDHPVDSRSDIYSLGVTAFELVTGRPPFTDQEIMAFFRADTPREIPSLSMLATPIDQGLERIISKACQHRREQRYGSMAEMAEELAALGEGHPDAPPIKESGYDSVTMRLLYPKKQRPVLDQLLENLVGHAQQLGLEVEMERPRISGVAGEKLIFGDRYGNRTKW